MVNIHKFIIHLSILASALCIQSCRANQIAPRVDFNITLDPSNSYVAGSTVSFKVSGNVDNLLFYSGEEGARYDHRDDPSGGGHGIVIKNMLNPVSAFSHTYDEPGTYRATIVGVNSNYCGTSRDVQELTINIIGK